MARRALLLMALLALASVEARADVSPSASRAGEALPRLCANDEWLGIKHAVARYCARRPDHDDCKWALENLQMQFCDGASPGDADHCAVRSLVLEDAERCWLEARVGSSYRVRVQPDCWSWHLEATRGRRSWRVTHFEIWVNGCD
jgi:hypothetical protein